MLFALPSRVDAGAEVFESDWELRVSRDDMLCMRLCRDDSVTGRKPAFDSMTAVIGRNPRCIDQMDLSHKKLRTRMSSGFVMKHFSCAIVRNLDLRSPADANISDADPVTGGDSAVVWIAASFGVRRAGHGTRCPSVQNCPDVPTGTELPGSKHPLPDVDVTEIVKSVRVGTESNMRSKLDDSTRIDLLDDESDDEMTNVHSFDPLQ